MRETRIGHFRICEMKFLPVALRAGKFDLDELKFNATIGEWREFILMGWSLSLVSSSQ